MNLDIGGQKHRRDFGGKWKIMDISPRADYVHNLNSNKPFPFSNNTINNIYTSDTLEHVEPSVLTFVLQEFYRILKPDGKCRIVVPNSRHAVKLYLKNPKELSNKKYCSKPKYVPATAMGYLSAWFHTNKDGKNTGHKIGFDEELLKAYIACTKFKKVSCMQYDKCSEVFIGKDYERYAGWSLYFELTK